MSGCIGISIVCYLFIRTLVGCRLIRHAFVPDGVYRAGIATSQEAYTKAVHELFDALDKVEKLLLGKDHLVGNQLTEADVRLYVTMVRCPESQ